MALWSKSDTQAGQPKFMKVGQLIGIQITGAAQSGYTSGSFTISAPPGGGTQATATYTAVGGKITSYVITNPGAGYTSAPTITAAGGTGATITGSIKAAVVPNSEVVLISREEAALTANRKKGVKGAGWYRITEKMQSDGTIRYLTETLVKFSKDALNALTGDVKGDDLVVGDVEIAITAQPAGITRAPGAAATFSVTATGASTYQWQVQTGGTGAYTNLANAGVYTTVTTATLNISSATGLGGNRYRCVVGNGGTAQVTSNGARLVVTA